jgi:hypothetical protein
MESAVLFVLDVRACDAEEENPVMAQAKATVQARNGLRPLDDYLIASAIAPGLRAGEKRAVCNTNFAAHNFCRPVAPAHHR